MKLQSILRFFGMLFLVAVWAGQSLAETQIIDARLAKVEDRTIVFNTPSGPIAVAFNERTKFWKDKSEATVDKFGEGEVVVARLKTNADPVELRELADKASWSWLDAVRKTPQQATVVQLDQKYLYVKLASGGEFKYRITEKSSIELKGKNPAVLSDLTPGLNVYVKGRTLATLDTWAILVSDQPIASNVKTSKNAKTGQAVRFAPLPTSGTLEAVVSKVTPTINMIDVLESGRILHVTYTGSTRFIKNGKPASLRDVGAGNRVKVTYRRDKLGRIIANGIEIAEN